MPKTPLFKLASRIACLAVLTSAALWLNVPVHADGFTCLLSANNTGGMNYVHCGSSAGDVLWLCNGAYCSSDPNMDFSAGRMCDDARANGCPEPVYYFD